MDSVKTARTPHPNPTVREIDERWAKATPGPWRLFDGCSWRRFGTDKNSECVVCPTTSLADGHPDLIISYENAVAIAAAPTDIATLRALLDEAERERGEAEGRRHHGVG